MTKKKKERKKGTGTQMGVISKGSAPSSPLQAAMRWLHCTHFLPNPRAPRLHLHSCLPIWKKPLPLPCSSTHPSSFQAQHSLRSPGRSGGLPMGSLLPLLPAPGLTETVPLMKYLLASFCPSLSLVGSFYSHQVCLPLYHAHSRCS